MHLKRLELLGFKSFAPRTVLELDRGVTAVVGPNGSGKSNLVDAVRWALGEQSLRAVRSRKSEEVIFAGGGRRAPVGMAEVTLTLDNSEGELPLPFAEVSVTRRLYRSGEGEYLINRSRARLRDVVELLSRVGLGSDSHVVVGQGAVDEVLLQRPEERRGLLEAAADISRHQLKLRESLDRLAETESNLRRIEDIRAEIAPRLARLRTQAARARRHEELSRRLREMELWRRLLQLRQSLQATAAASDAERTLAERAQAAADARAARGEELTRLREALRAEESALEAARERVGALRVARARFEREAALLRERESAYRRQLAEAGAELEAAGREQRDLAAEMEKMGALRAELEERRSRFAAEMDPLEAERRRSLAEQRLLQAQLERAVAGQQSAARRSVELQERRNALARDARKAETVQSESQEAGGEAAARLAQLEEKLAASRQDVQRLQAELAGLGALRQGGRERSRALAEQLEAARRREREAWERDNDLRHRITLLRSLKEEHRGLAPGAKVLLDARLPGTLGPLATMLRVPEEYVTAVAAALGGAQGYVVVEGFEDGLKALRFLTDRHGRATIAPLHLDGVTPLRPPSAEFRAGLNGVVEGVGFRGVAADLVSCLPEARELCTRYLGWSLVVESMADAVELHRRLARAMAGDVPYQVVTMDGRLLRARGDLASAQNGEKEGGLLSREAELLSLSQVVERAGALLAEARGSVAALERARADLTREAGEQAAKAAALEGEIRKRTAALAELDSQVARLETAMEWHRSRVATAERDLAQGREALSRIEGDLAGTLKDEREARERAEQMRDDLGEQQAVVAEVVARLSRRQAEAAAARNRLGELEARFGAVAEAVGRADARVKRLAERKAQMEAELSAMQREPRLAFPASSVDELRRSELRVAEGSASVDRLRRECDVAEGELAALTRGQDEARDGLAAARGRAQRSVAELAGLVREAARESGSGSEEADGESSVDLRAAAGQMVKTLGELLADAPLDTFPAGVVEASERAEGLRREVQSLGTVNAEAPEEYRQVSERHTFLTDQVDDLRRAERTLRKAVDDLKEVMEARFREAFDRVNVEFGHCFSTLFGGGSARLVLSQPDQPLEGGVDVVAVPPGRKGGSLLGLSGGERALTAVALLFALMKVNPSPFCVLDEVDAALDESNVQRFCDMLRELARTTQFVVITHNRVTMEMADALYGVSMSGEAISRIVSSRLASGESGA